MQQRFGGRWLMVTGAILALVMVGSTAAHTDHHVSGTPESHDHGHMMGSTGNGVIYLTITNTGDDDDALVGGETDRAERIEIHEMIVEDGTARMQAVDGSTLPIPAGETVTLEPAGLHMMMINLTEDNRAGDVFEVTLEFEQAGEVTLQVPVRLDAEPIGDEPESERVEAGDLVIEGAWSRPAPRIDGGMMMGTPDATPAP